jgi:hypothetical protein
MREDAESLSYFFPDGNLRLLIEKFFGPPEEFFQIRSL